MRRLTYFIGSTIDGVIAGPSGEIDFYPYAHLRQYVVSQSITDSPDPRVEIVSGDPIAKVRELGIYLAGGSQLAGGPNWPEHCCLRSTNSSSSSTRSSPERGFRCSPPDSTPRASSSPIRRRCAAARSFSPTPRRNPRCGELSRSAAVWGAVAEGAAP